MAIRGLLFLPFLVVSGLADLAIIDKSFIKYGSKRLASVTKIMTSLKFVECTFHCMETDGCYAVHFKHQNRANCELTSGLSDVNEMVDDVSSDLYVMDYNQCAKEPGYCLNGATCEPTWTSARCHCADRYQGDRCDNCTERFQGDGCRECSERFQGNGCGECSERFQGDGCQECSHRFQGDKCDACTAGYYGDICDVGFALESDKDCNVKKDIHWLPKDVSTGHEACKIWCANNATCGAFVVGTFRCWFKEATCENDMHSKLFADIYLKQIN